MERIPAPSHETFYVYSGNMKIGSNLKIGNNRINFKDLPLD
jgi:hypothetical protein